ncbi:MAG: efflux RND transporter periplasmic adaptor subunit [Methylophilaceae bacterium]
MNSDKIMRFIQINRLWMVVVAAAAIIFVLYKAFSHPSNKETADQTTPNIQMADNASPKAALTVSAVKPQHASMNKTLPANGNIAAWQEASIGAEVNGLPLREVLVDLGDTVKKGQVLARFSTTTIDADLAQAQANLAEAKAAAAEAEGNANRARSIQDTGALSKQQVEQLLSAESTTKARLEAMEAAVKTQEIRLRQTIVTAPDYGIISSRTASVGQIASSGQELFHMIQQGRIEWRADLTAADTAAVRKGTAARIILANGPEIKGSVRSLAPIVDSSTRNAKVYVDIPAGSAKPGMFARGYFVLGKADVLTLPANAIVMRDGFDYVMLLDKNSRVRQMKVLLGQRSGDQVEVTNLPAIDGEYVANGGSFLNDGDLVKVVEINALPAPTPAK